MLQYFDAGIITDHITQEDHLLVFAISGEDGEKYYKNNPSVILESNEWHSGTVTVG